MEHVSILIIGAGPTGLTAATLLARYGVSFRIIDQKSGPTDQSRALGVQARTLELWDKLGMADKAIDAGQRLRAMYLLTKRSVARGAGKPFLTLSRDGNNLTPYPFLLVYEQNKTEHMLLDDLNRHNVKDRAGCVEWNTAIVALTQDTAAVTVTLQHANGEQEVVQADWLVAADGAHSFVRRSLELDFEGSTYAETLFLADVDLEWSLPRDVFYAELLRHGVLAFFPMRGDSYNANQYRIIGSVPPEIPDAQQISREDVQQLLNRHSAARGHISNMRWSSIYRIHRRMTEKFRVGRIFLAGDAAHIHSPAGGQGMNTGIQDSWNLIWKLALVARGAAKADLLDSYEPERMPVARVVLNGSDRGFSFAASTNYFVHLLRKLLVPLLSNFTGHRLLGTRIFRFVSQTWIGYGDSPVVAGADTASAAQPGDRTPHAVFDTGPHQGHSIFELLRGVEHHLLLFPGERTAADAIRSQLEALLQSYAIPIQLHCIAAAQPSLYAAYAVAEPSILLVRPDGHIAWRGALEQLQEFQEYLDQWYTRSKDVD